MPVYIDDKVKRFVEGHPWLKIVLKAAIWVLGYAKAHEWFAKRYSVK